MAGAHQMPMGVAKCGRGASEWAGAIWPGIDGWPQVQVPWGWQSVAGAHQMAMGVAKCGRGASEWVPVIGRESTGGLKYRRHGGGKVWQGRSRREAGRRRGGRKKRQGTTLIESENPPSEEWWE